MVRMGRGLDANTIHVSASIVNGSKQNYAFRQPHSRSKKGKSFVEGGLKKRAIILELLSQTGDEIYIR